MATCTFFGHRDCPGSIKPKLREVLIDLIENHAVDTFYVGRQGAFDAIVRSVLRELVSIYPHIRYAIVLERMSPNRDLLDSRDYSDTMLPEGIKSVRPRYAISWRNNWMLKQSDYVVTYITHSWGGATQFAEKAARQKKIAINLAESVFIDYLSYVKYRTAANVNDARRTRRLPGHQCLDYWVKRPFIVCNIFTTMINRY